MSKYIKLNVILALVLAPTTSFAQYYYGQNNSYQIAQMQAQLDALRAQLASMGYSSSYTYPYNYQYQTYPYTYGSTGAVLGATYYGGYGSQYGQYGVNSCNFTVNLALGMTHPQVADLNRMLGVSSGSYFDQSTYAAVVNFQNMYAGEILAPAGLVYANGYVGPLTRAKLNAVCNGITTSTSGYYGGNVLGASTYNPYGYYGGGYNYGTYYTGAPTLNLYVSSQNVNYNDTVTLNWNSTNASYCTASGAWTGNKNVNGSESRSNITYATTFTLTCYSPSGQSVVRSVTVTPYNSGSAGTPTMSFYANPSNVYVGGSTTLYWTVNNASTCSASGSWSGSKVMNGNEVVGNITNTRTYTLSCTSSTNQTTTQSVTVGVL